MMGRHPNLELTVVEFSTFKMLIDSCIGIKHSREHRTDTEYLERVSQLLRISPGRIYATLFDKLLLSSIDKAPSLNQVAFSAFCENFREIISDLQKSDNESVNEREYLNKTYNEWTQHIANRFHEKDFYLDDKRKSIGKDEYLNEIKLIKSFENTKWICFEMKEECNTLVQRNLSFGYFNQDKSLTTILSDTEHGHIQWKGKTTFDEANYRLNISLINTTNISENIDFCIDIFYVFIETTVLLGRKVIKSKNLDCLKYQTCLFLNPKDENTNRDTIEIGEYLISSPIVKFFEWYINNKLIISPRSFFNLYTLNNYLEANMVKYNERCFKSELFGGLSKCNTEDNFSSFYINFRYDRYGEIAVLAFSYDKNLGIIRFWESTAYPNAQKTRIIFNLKEFKRLGTNYKTEDIILDCYLDYKTTGDYKKHKIKFLFPKRKTDNLRELRNIVLFSKKLTPNYIFEKRLDPIHGYPPWDPQHGLGLGARPCTLETINEYFENGNQAPPSKICLDFSKIYTNLPNYSAREDV